MSETIYTPKDFCGDEGMKEWLSLDDPGLLRLRRNGMPAIRVGDKRYVYYTPDVARWLGERRGNASDE